MPRVDVKTDEVQSEGTGPGESGSIDVDRVARRLAEVVPLTDRRAHLIARPIRSSIGMATNTGIDLILGAVGPELNLTYGNVEAVADALVAKYADLIGYPDDEANPA